MNNRTLTEVEKLRGNKAELKQKVKNLQGLVLTQIEIIRILERRVKRHRDLADLRNESIENLIRKQRRILRSLEQFEEENTRLKTENRSLKRVTCCHRNEC